MKEKPWQQLRRLGAGAIFSCMLLLSAQTQAGTDWKTYPASACHPSNLSIAVYDSTGQVCNQSTSQDLFVFCPLTREAATTGRLDYVRVFGRSGSTVEDLTCTVRSIHRNDYVWDDNNLYGWFFTIPSIEIDVFDFSHYRGSSRWWDGGIGEDDYGSFILTCKLPNMNAFDRSCLASYGHREKY